MSGPQPLLTPFQLGPYKLRNRVVMAPLTRMRSTMPGNIPGPINAVYYRQRASMGLTVTEATQVSPQGYGYPGTPGIHSPRQVEGWKQVVNAVHEEGGLIFLQLWHVGRVSHPSLQEGNALPVAPSAVKINGETRTHGVRGNEGRTNTLRPEGVLQQLNFPGLRPVRLSGYRNHVKPALAATGIISCQEALGQASQFLLLEGGHS